MIPNHHEQNEFSVREFETSASNGGILSCSLAQKRKWNLAGFPFTVDDDYYVSAIGKEIRCLNVIQDLKMFGLKLNKTT